MPLQAAPNSPLLLAAKTAPMKSGYFSAILLTATFEASVGEAPLRISSTAKKLKY